MFAQMQQQDVFSWTALIGAYAQQRQGKKAFDLFQQMRLQGVMPNKFAFVSLLPACDSQTALADGKQIHALIVGCELESDVVLGTTLVNMYAKCGGVEYAKDMFDSMCERNVVSWTAIITAYAQQRKGKQALQLFHQMLLEGIIPDNVTFISILDGCAGLAEVSHIHVYTLVTGYESDVVIGNAFITLYAKCGCPLAAWKTFHTMHERTVVSWTAIIAAYTEHGFAKEALQFFHRMHLEGVTPNQVTLTCILSACGNLDTLVEGKRMHARTVGSEFESDVVVGNAILNLYSRCGSLEDAESMFERMPSRDVISWNIMITAHAQHGQGREAFRLLEQMWQECLIPDKVTFINILEACRSQAALDEGIRIHCYILDQEFEIDDLLGTALIDMYAKCGSLEAAWRVFENMQERDLILWTTMIAAYAHNGHCKEALHLLHQMWLEGLMLNMVIMLSIMMACGNLVDLSEGKQMHARIVPCELEVDVIIGTGLVNMYGRCGTSAEARQVFDKLSKHSVSLWNAMILAYAQNGQGEEALWLFQQMQQEGIIPDEITFSSILTACSHAGLVEEGCHYFVCLVQDHSIKSAMDHYVCMVDLLGRAGQLDEVENLIQNAPFAPTATLWISLLGSCRLHFDMDRGERAAKHTFKLVPDNAIPYVMLSNIYAASRRMDDAMPIRKISEEVTWRSR